MTLTIDLVKLFRYYLKRVWILILCAIIGFGVMYYNAEYMTPDSYTASATMYVYNANPNIVNYQYANTSDLSAAVMLVDTYMVVIRSNKVMDAVAERLDYQLPPEYISSTLSVGSVSETGVMQISSTTHDPQLSMDICNAVADIAPAEIIRVVSAGSVEVIDYAQLPEFPNAHGAMRKGLIGAAVGVVLAGGVLFLLFVLNRRLGGSNELTENYSLPLLANIPKQHTMESQSYYLLSKKTPSQVLAAYGKLRMNLFFTLQGKTKVVIVSSAVPGENKSTVSANLAISFAMDGKHVLLIDADMRKPSQSKLFKLDEKSAGLSNLLVPGSEAQDVIHKGIRENLDLLTAGIVPPNPSELLNSPAMRALLEKFKEEYDLIILDTPPINVVSDALVLSDADVGMLFLARCDYSDHREIRKAVTAAEFTGINMLGMAMTCATRSGDSYYGYRYYKHYYGAYDKYLKDAADEAGEKSRKKHRKHKKKKRSRHSYF